MAMFSTPLELEVFDDGTFTLTGMPAGPAGVLAVALDAGTVLETDAAEPGRFVQLIADSPESLRHVEPLFGPGAANEITKLVLGRSRGAVRTVEASRRRQDLDPGLGRFATLLGRASTVHDAGIDEPVQAAAFLDTVEASAGVLPGPLATAVLDSAIDAAADLLEETVEELASLAEDDDEIAARLYEQTDERYRDLVPGLAEPMGRLHAEVFFATGSLRMPSSAPRPRRRTRTVAGPARALAAAGIETAAIVFHEPNGVEVRRSSGDEGEWLEAVRADDLVTVAFVPFRGVDGGSNARLLLPLDELGSTATTREVLERYQFRIARSASVPARTIDRVIAAINAGKSALMAERLGDRRGAARWWTACARGWDDLDPERASIARQRATARSRISGDEPPTADLVANHRWYRS